jgi:hypothetical protein
MKFPASFTRYVGTVPAGKTALGADTLPTARPAATMDNLLASKFNNINGWPAHRVAVVYNGPAGAPNLTATMYFYEDATAAWYQIGAAGTLVSGQVTFFDVIAIMEMPNTSADLANATPGSIAQVLIVAAPGGSPPSGPYEFAMATDLTTQA